MGLMLNIKIKGEIITMAKKKNQAQAEPKTEAPVVAPAAPAVPATIETINAELTGIKAEIDGLVKRYNESAMFAEFKAMQKLSGDIAEKIGAYNDKAESAHFIKLKHNPNPMAAAALDPYYVALRTANQKKPDGGTILAVVSGDKAIDPAKLYKYLHGEMPVWSVKIERLNKLLTVAAGVRFGMDPKKIMDTIRMSGEASSALLPREGDLNDRENLLVDVQSIVNEMLGEEHELTDEVKSKIGFMHEVHTKAGKKLNGIGVARDASTRQRMLVMCAAALTGKADVIVEYQRKKSN